MNLTVGKLKEILNNSILKDSDKIEFYDTENQIGVTNVTDIVLTDQTDGIYTKFGKSLLNNKDISLKEKERKVSFQIEF